MAAPAHGQGTQHAAMSPKVAQTCPGSHCASALHPTCTQKPPSTHTRDGGRASTCSRHWPTGPQCPQGAPSSEQPGCSVVVEVALVVVVVDGPGWPVAAIGFQRTTSTAATIATPGTAYPVPSLPTCRAVNNGVLYIARDRRARGRCEATVGGGDGAFRPVNRGTEGSASGCRGGSRSSSGRAGGTAPPRTRAHSARAACRPRSARCLWWGSTGRTQRSPGGSLHTQDGAPRGRGRTS